MNFLSLYKFMHETGHPAAPSGAVPYPASRSSYHSLYNDGGQDIFAQFSIYLCLHPEKAGNSELYNIGDSAEGKGMVDRWAYICSLFGLEGKAPLETSDPKSIKPVRFVAEHSDVVQRLREEKGVELQTLSRGLLSGAWMEALTFNHDYYLDKARATGFEEELTVEESWKMVLDRYFLAKKVYYGNR